MLATFDLKCDLCVVGGGISGMCAAISAAREGLNVVLMHERPVLGGNASSEIRMWICGAKGKNNRETGIIEEISLENLYRNPTKSYAVWDTVLYDFIKREKNITLLLNCTCMDAETDEGVFEYGRTKKIRSVTGYQMTTQKFFKVCAKYYCDSSGDSILAPLCGADFRMGREGKENYGEKTINDKPDSKTMGMTCILQGCETNEKIKYIPPVWSTKLNESHFEGKELDIYQDTENYWYLELGGEKNTISDTEEIKDELISLATGTWDYIKNSGKYNAESWDMSFLGFLPGKRESRRMCGEYTLTQNDISGNRFFDDEAAFGGWGLDDHYPGGFFHKGTTNSDRVTPSPYSIPLRSLYSSNVDNLFFAGRNISMTHTALSSVRVMATCALLGEAVGKAASVASENNIAIHRVYLDKTKEVQKRLLDEDCFLPSKKRDISEACRKAALENGDERLRDGFDRLHRLYGNEAEGFFSVKNGKSIIYTFEKTYVSSVHIVFDSDLDRLTLKGSECERIHTTRCNKKLDSPQMYMPKTLCRSFVLNCECGGVSEELLNVRENRKRAYHIKTGKVFDKLTLTVFGSWGDTPETNVVSFDFN